MAYRVKLISSRVVRLYKKKVDGVRMGPEFAPKRVEAGRLRWQRHSGDTDLWAAL